MANLRQEALETIPATPGVYLFKDQDDNIIYVGKAKNLRPRVKSYFQSSPGDGRALFRIIVKNTADIEMVVAAMEICYTQPQISGIVIVSSDSDFTPLAIHLRERGKLVLGYGKENSVSSFIDACTHWTSVDIDEEDKWV